MTGYPYYCFKEEGIRRFYEGRYWNANGKAVSIIAVVTGDIDWATYIGADNGYREEDCLVWTAEKGVKLLAQDAKHFFPDIKLPYRG